MPNVNVTWDHVHLRSPDPEATAAWLEDILGGEIVRGPGRIDVKLGGANVFIAPVADSDGVNAPPVTPYQGLDHFGLTVKDIDAVAAEIKAKGVEFTKPPTTIRPGVRICFIRGPQGISIELLERDKNIPDAPSPHRRSNRVLRHATGHEAADAQSQIALDRPDHGSSDPVRLGDDSILGTRAIALNANAVAPLIPIHIADGAAIGIGTARPLAALQTVEPLLQR